MTIEERFEFTAGAKKKVLAMGAIGVISLIIGFALLMFGGHEAGHAGDASGEHAYHWIQRLWSNLWINNVFFTGLSIIGVFFVAIQYVSQAGWSAGLKRVPEAFGYWLPIAGVLMLVVFFLGGHDLFHWTHDYLYDKNDPRYDAIIAGKQTYLNTAFFVGRMVAYFALWYWFFLLIRKASLAEDLNGGDSYWRKMVKYSAIFCIIFGVTSSTSAWDWVMSIDTHWFSTMFGWYVFASWWVSGLAVITLTILLLKDAGYLKHVNSNHLHDLGKFIFAFSIFWTYIWFSQFLLIYYANIPEETVYFWERLNSDYYGKIFFVNLILNFFFPFLVLMTRDAKRQVIFLKIVTITIIGGHWLDFYLMITPGTLGEHGGFHFFEIGWFLVYGAAFIYVVASALAKAPLTAKNHPMLEESMHHHI